MGAYEDWPRGGERSAVHVMSARRDDTPVCECGHADTGHNRQRRGMFAGYGSRMRSNGRRGFAWMPCPCMRFAPAGGAR